MELSLALGGGGAKGNAHFGVIRCLEKEGFKIKAIAGASAGGLFGALYAAGYSPDESIDRFKKIDQSKLYGLGKGPSLLGTAGVEQVLRDMLGDSRFEDLRIPFAVTAVDIKSGREVVIRQGRLIDALLATMAFPGIFPPREWYGYLLVDGGVLNNVPVCVARQLAPNLPVVAVVLSKPLETEDQVSFPIAFWDHTPMLKPIARLRVAQALNVFLNSIEIGGRGLTELRLKIDQPDVIIRPDVTEIGLLDKVDVAEVALKGEQAAQAALPEIRQAGSWRGGLRRWTRQTFDIWHGT